MADKTLQNFVLSVSDEIIRAMDGADEEPRNTQYRLGVRKVAWAFFHKVELFGIDKILPELNVRDVDAWFAGRE